MMSPLQCWWAPAFLTKEKIDAEVFYSMKKSSKYGKCIEKAALVKRLGVGRGGKKVVNASPTSKANKKSKLQMAAEKKAISVIEAVKMYPTIWDKHCIIFKAADSGEDIQTNSNRLEL